MQENLVNDSYAYRTNAATKVPSELFAKMTLKRAEAWALLRYELADQLMLALRDDRRRVQRRTSDINWPKYLFILLPG